MAQEHTQLVHGDSRIRTRIPDVAPRRSCAFPLGMTPVSSHGDEEQQEGEADLCILRGDRQLRRVTGALWRESWSNSPADIWSAKWTLRLAARATFVHLDCGHRGMGVNSE